ncbi:hypothetical protein O181_075040 [Austropuccinia psidii MF-1]|uniref:Chromo domain-containing protein n=1 Tax=Austropuccinia psidii MF-1 TaxID=1389203 RepID=A0A9Q3FDM2_9BASI|nr:hypothetical protein [Austropuccinia psidii MF-1]
MTYCPCFLATLPDSLSHWDIVYPERGEDFISKNTMNFKQLIKQDEFQPLNSDHSSTKQSPFFTVHGGDPYFDSGHITQDTPAGKLSTKIQSVRQYFTRELEVSINKFQRYADKTGASPRVFIPGYMSALVPTISMEVNPLSLPYFPLRTIQDINNPKLASRASPPIIIEEDEEWEVSQILDSKIKRETLWYLVELKGFSQDPERSTLEPTKNLNGCPELVKYFHFLYPDKPGPHYLRA